MRGLRRGTNYSNKERIWNCQSNLSKLEVSYESRIENVIQMSQDMNTGWSNSSWFLVYHSHALVFGTSVSHVYGQCIRVDESRIMWDTASLLNLGMESYYMEPNFIALCAQTLKSQPQPQHINPDNGIHIILHWWPKIQPTSRFGMTTSKCNNISLVVRLFLKLLSFATKRVILSHLWILCVCFLTWVLHNYTWRNSYFMFYVWSSIVGSSPDAFYVGFLFWYQVGVYV